MSEVKKELIEKTLEDIGITGNIIFFDEIDSTNNVAKQLAIQKIESNTLVVAKRQSCGRGRLGRSFMSLGNGIYFSVILRPDSSVENSLKITSGAAVAVRRVLSKYCDDVKIKWVNDIYISEKKVCGILTEAASSDGGTLDYVVVGIGINVFGRHEDFGDELSDIVTTLEENTNSLLDKNLLIASVYKELLDIISELDSFNSVMDEYRKHNIIIGKSVYIIRGDEKRLAEVIDIDNEGSLIAVDEATKEQMRISSGEVSIRFSKRTDRNEN